MEAALGRELLVFPAPDIPTANDVLNQEAVDLVILDVRLDGESGLDFLAHLRETSDVPVLLISGYGTKDTVIEGLRSRACDYLDKPLSATQLQDRARMLIFQGRARATSRSAFDISSSRITCVTGPWRPWRRNYASRCGQCGWCSAAATGNR